MIFTQISFLKPFVTSCSKSFRSNCDESWKDYFVNIKKELNNAIQDNEFTQSNSIYFRILHLSQTLLNKIEMDIENNNLSISQNSLMNMIFLWELSNFIWYEIGDKSLDINFYSKRMILAMIYLVSINKICKNQDYRKFLSQSISLFGRVGKKKYELLKEFKELCDPNDRRVCDTCILRLLTSLEMIKKIPFLRLFYIQFKTL